MIRYPEDTLSSNNNPELEWISLPTVVSLWLCYRYFEHILTDGMPSVGYFIAGGLAGVISRTVTAPFDRLKVYLIAQTGVKETAIRTMKSVAPFEAVVRSTWPLVEAMKELWRAGGLRSLFAGLPPPCFVRCKI
jgi:solute carrier family 25 phosphate transporter 23/24/25/41